MRTTLLLSLSFLTALGARGEATSVAPCVAGTLLSYRNMTGGCELGGGSGGILVFSGFTYSSSALDALTVTPDPQGLGGGFAFGGLSVGVGQTATYQIDYSYFIDSGPVSSGADIGMDPPFGNVSITEAICADSVFVSTDSGPQCQFANDPFAPQTFSVDDTDPQTSWTNHLDLNPIVTRSAEIEDTIVLDGGSTGAGFDGSTATSTVVVPTPEPLTLLTALGGLLAIGLLRLLRRSECG